MTTIVHNSVWRKRTMKHWTYNQELLTLTHTDSDYEIDLETCIDSAEMLDWIFQYRESALNLRRTSRI